MNEYFVTKSIATYLKEKDWDVVSVNAPFSGRAIWIKPRDAFRGKGALIPDIIAVKDKRLLIVECAAPYKYHDELKLCMYRTDRYIGTLYELFKFDFGPAPITAIGIPASDMERVRDKTFVVFGVTPNCVIVEAPSELVDDFQ